MKLLLISAGMGISMAIVGYQLGITPISTNGFLFFVAGMASFIGGQIIGKDRGRKEASREIAAHIKSEVERLNREIKAEEKQ